jgi:hypothetical protein
LIPINAAFCCDKQETRFEVAYKKDKYAEKYLEKRDIKELFIRKLLSYFFDYYNKIAASSKMHKNDGEGIVYILYFDKKIYM